MVHSEGERHFYCFTKTSFLSVNLPDSLLCVSLGADRRVQSARITDMGSADEKNRTFFEEFSSTISPPDVLRELYEEYTASL